MKKRVWVISIVCIILIVSLPIPVLRLVQYYNFMTSSKVTQIEDVTQRTTVLLSSEGDPNDIYGIIVNINGYIDGSAIIRQSYEDQETYTHDIKQGKVRLKIGGDWYDSKCLIEYKPVNVSSGNLNIRYKFYDISVDGGW